MQITVLSAMILQTNTALCFDDVLLVPRLSGILSRKNVDLKSPHAPLPFISAPMDTVTGSLMAVELARLGCSAVLHRYCSIEDQVSMFEWCKSKLSNVDIDRVWCAVPALADAHQRIAALWAASCYRLCIDVAHGDHEVVYRLLDWVEDHYPEASVMVGNIATPEAWERLDAYMMVDAIKVGIGGGSTCTTRIVTGHGLPTLQSVLDIVQQCPKRHALLIADGGIRNSGDMAKALAAGADMVMLGSMLARAVEAPGEVSPDGKSKVYRGMASVEAQTAWRGWVSSTAEGVSAMVPIEGTAKDIIEKAVAGLQSALSYSGTYNLDDFRRSAIMRAVSTVTLNESRPRILQK